MNPSDVPGTDDFAYDTAMWLRDAEIDEFVDGEELVIHEVTKLACLARDISGMYRVVIGARNGIMLDGSQPTITPTLFALGLDRQTRQSITGELGHLTSTLAVVFRDDGEVTLYNVCDDDGTGVPPDPAKWCFEKLSLVYWDEP